MHRLKNPAQVQQLFADWEETLIYSCLQNIMGAVYVQNPQNPQAAMAILGDFSFFAGIPNQALIAYKPPECSASFRLMIPQNDAWAEQISRYYGGHAKKVTRYALKKEPDIFNRAQLLHAVAALPPEYKIYPIDRQIYQMCLEHAWSRDLVAQFSSYALYQKLGLGAAILKNGQLVCGASSYSRYLHGIEIEIDTREDERRHGLAYACGAKLILMCLEHELYPSWDAQNLWSVTLAKKLGYHFDFAYTAYEVTD